MASETQVQGNGDGVSFDAAWTDVRANSEIQFTPSPAKPPQQPPALWTDFLEWLGDVLGPVAEAVVWAWPVLRIVLLLILAAGVLTLSLIHI